MTVSSSATISLNLTVANEQAWSAVVNTVNDLKTALAGLSKGNSRNSTLSIMAAQLKTLRTEFDNFKAEVQAATGIQDKNSASLQKNADIAGQVTAKKLAMAAAVNKNFDADVREQRALQAAGAAANQLEGYYNKLTKTLNNNPLFAKSRQASGLRSIQQEMKAAQVEADKFVTSAGKMGKAIDPAKLKQFQQAALGADASLQRWGNDMKTLAGRLTFFEQQMDAVLRASYRFKAAGADLMRVAQGIQRGFQSIMTTFGQFDFNIRRAVGALGAFDGYAGGVQAALNDLSTAAVKVAREIKFIPVDEVAKGFYFWGSMTGAVVNNLDDVNKLVEEHTAVLKVASMTEVDFESALKGVYSVITQFYNGNLSQTVDITEKMFYVTQKTAAEFTDLIQSFKMVGPVAQGLHVKFEDVLTTIGDLADLGMRGSMAGRAIRQIFIQAVKPSGPALAELKTDFAAFKDTFDQIPDIVKKNLGDTYTILKNAGSYYDAIFPQGEYAGIQNQLKVLAAMTLNMTTAERQHMLGVMSTANSLPVLMALVGRQVSALQSDIQQKSKLNLDDAKRYFQANWDLLSASWKGVTGALQRSWESFKVTVGATIAKVLTPLFNILTDIVNKITDWAAANPKIVEALAKIAAFVGVFTAIAGAVLTATGAVMGLVAVSYVAFNSFFFVAKKSNEVLVTVGEKFKFLSGLADAFKANWVPILGTIIALIQSVARNFDYVAQRVGSLVDSVTKNFGGLGNGISLVAQALNSFNEGFSLVFDQIVKRIADFIALLGNVVDAIGGVGKIVHDIFPALGDAIGTAIDLGGKLIGIMVALATVSKISALLTGFSFFNLSLRGAVTQLNLVRSGAISAGFALKGMMASSGIGLLIVGLSLLVDWLGQNQKSMADLKAETKSAAAEFGDFADQAETAARKASSAWAAIQRAALDANKAQAAAANAASAPPAMGALPANATQQQIDMQSAYAAQRQSTVEAAQQMSDQIDASWATIQAKLETKTQEILAGWKSLVEETNYKLSQAGMHYQIDIGQLLKVNDAVASQYSNLDQSIQDSISKDLLSLNPAASNEAIQRAIYAIRAKYEAEGIELGNDFNNMAGIVADKAAQHLAEQGRNDAIIKRLIDSAGLGVDSNMSDWLNFIKGQVTLTDGQRMSIEQALAGDMFSADGMKQILDGVMKGAGEAAAKLKAENEIPQMEITAMSDTLKEGFIALTSAAIADAMPGMNEIITKIGEQSSLGDLGTIMATILTDQVGNGFGTLADMMKAGTLPDDIQKGLLEYVNKAVAQGVPGAKALSDAIKAAGQDLPGNIDTAMADFMKSTKDAFLSALDGNLVKSFKDLKKELNKRLMHPEKYADSKAISELLNELASPTINWAIEQGNDSQARKLAEDRATQDINAAIGGITTAFANANTDEAKAAAQKKLENFVTGIVDLPDVYWTDLDPTVAQGIWDWLKSQNITVPDSVRTDLEAALGHKLDDPAITNPSVTVTPSVTLNKLDLNPSFNDAIVPGKPGFTNRTNPIVAAVVPPATSDQTAAAITKAVSDAVAAVLPSIPGLTTAVGTEVVAGIVKGVSAAVGLATYAVTATLDAMSSETLKNKADSGGNAIGSAWGAGLVRALQNTKDTISGILASIRAMMQGNSPPPEGPLKDIDKGGTNAANAWGDAFAKGVADTAKKVKDPLKKLQKQLSGAQGTLRKWLGILDNSTGRKHTWIEKDLIPGMRQRVTDAQNALDKYLNKHGDTPGKHHPGHTGTQGHTGHTGDGAAAAAVRHMKEWRDQIVNYRKQITDLFLGGLTEEEKRRKTYLEELIGDVQYKMDHVKGPKNHKHGGDNTDPTSTGPHVGDTNNNATVTDVTKRVIEIHVDVESKDGSVDRITRSDLKKAIMDAFTLSDIKHIVTVN